MADSIERIAADCAWESHRLRNSGAELADYEAWERIATRLRALSPAGGDWQWRPLLQWAIGTIEELNDGPMTADQWEEDAGLFASAKSLAFASPQQEPGADGCGACGDSCANRGACRLADDSPTRLYALAAAIRGEADIADRPGQMARLNAIADELSVHSKPTPADDPSGQTLAGAGDCCACGDGCVSRGSCRLADESPNPVPATSAGTAGDDSEDAARLDFMQANRVALIPEFEGPWDAEIYGEDGHAVAVYSGTTPRAAIDAARRAREV